MKVLFYVFTPILLASMASAACTGSYKGFLEKQPLSGGGFSPVQTFTIDPNSGVIEQCDINNSFSGNFLESGDSMQFGYARRTRNLNRVSDGTFSTGTWQAEFNGVVSNYRIRVETR